MTKGGRFYMATFVALIGFIGVAGKGSAAQCAVHFASLGQL